MQVIIDIADDDNERFFYVTFRCHCQSTGKVRQRKVLSCEAVCWLSMFYRAALSHWLFHSLPFSQNPALHHLSIAIESFVACPFRNLSIYTIALFRQTNKWITHNIIKKDYIKFTACLIVTPHRQVFASIARTPKYYTSRDNTEYRLSATATPRILQLAKSPIDEHWLFDK